MRIRLFRVVVALLACVFICPAFAHAATRTWDNGSGDGKWSTCQNWSNNTCPGSGDSAKFDDTSAANASIDVSIDVKGITIDGDYTGTITQANGVTVTVGSGDFKQEAGTFSGGNSAIDINDKFELTGGTFTSTSGTLSVSGNFEHSAGTFTHSSGTVVLDGSNQTLSGTTAFNNLTKTVTAAATLTLPASVTTTVVGTATLRGASGQRLSLRSSNAATQTKIDLQGSRSFEYLDVQDTNNVNATVANCFTSCVNTANTTNWDFNANIQFSAASSSGGEATGPATLTITIEEAIGVDATVDYTVTGTATGGGTDYTLASGTATITAGNTSTPISIVIVNDSLDENDETVIATLSNPTNGELGSTTSHTFTITDDDDAPTVAFNAASGSGTESTASVSLAVLLSAVSSKAITVDYAVTGGTATGNTDYTLASGTLTFAAGESSKTIAATVIDDTLDETDETIIVTLSNPSNASLGATSAHTYTIADDDAAPTVSINDVAVTETVVTATFTVSLSAISAKVITVNYASVNGTASAGADYTANSGSLSFAAGESSKTIAIAVLGDTLDEENEGFTITLSNPANASIADGSGAGTIVDNDAAPSVTLTASSSSLSENAGSATLTLSLSAASSKTVTITLAFTGTATTGDYSASASAVTIAAGASTGTVQLTAVQDAVDEPNETIVVDITAVTNGTEATPQQVTLSLIDDDEAEEEEDEEDEENTEEETEEEAEEEEIEEEIPLVANAGTDRSVVAGARMTLDGSGSTGEGIQYAWSIVSGAGVLENADSVAPTYTAPLSSAVVTLQLQLTDETGMTSSDSMIVHVFALSQIKNELIAEGLVGVQDDGLPIYEEEQDGAIVLRVDEVELTLPKEDCQDYTVALTQNGFIAIGCSQSTNNRGTVYLSVVSVHDISGSVSLETDISVEKSVDEFAEESDAEAAVAAASTLIAVSGSREEDGLGKYLAVGDVNGDGRDEILIAAPRAGNHGVVYIYSEDGVLTGTIFGSAETPISAILTSVSIGDDQVTDLFFAPNNLALNMNLRYRAALTPEEKASSTFFLLGGSDLMQATVDFESVLPDVTIDSEQSYQSAAFGDLNSDLWDDLVVATDNGVALFFGPIALAADLTIDDADSVIIDDDAVRNQDTGFGQMLAIGDVSGDGSADIVIGHPSHGTEFTGRICVVFGSSWPLEISTADNSILCVSGTIPNDELGSDLLLADTNADGVEEIYTVNRVNQVYKLDLVSDAESESGETDDAPAQSPYLRGSGIFGCALGEGVK